MRIINFGFVDTVSFLGITFMKDTKILKSMLRTSSYRDQTIMTLISNAPFKFGSCLLHDKAYIILDIKISYSFTKRRLEGPRSRLDIEY